MSDRHSERHSLPGLRDYVTPQERITELVERGMNAVERRRFYLKLAANLRADAAVTDDPGEKNLLASLAESFRVRAERPALKAVPGDGSQEGLGPPQAPLMHLHQSEPTAADCPPDEP